MEIFGRNYLDPVEEIGENNERKKEPVQDSRPEREAGL